MSIEKYAYLLDQDNYIIENKIFIDLMWYISKNKDNGKNQDSTSKPAGINTKSYVIRNAGIMFQQIFYWHYKYIKKGNPTPYQYNNGGNSTNVIKMDFSDWWESIRLTQKEITSANKFLEKTNLITIRKMRIKEKDKQVFKPCNCYALNLDVFQEYIDKMIEISSEIYKDKIVKRKEETKRSAEKYKLKKSTEQSTEDSVITETAITCNSEPSEGVEDKLSTLSTLSTSGKSPVITETGITKAITETGITKAITETGITKAITETEITNKSNTSTNTSTNTSCTDTESSPSFLWENVLANIKNNLSEVSYDTWFKGGIKEAHVHNDILEIKTVNNFIKDILINRYSDMISQSAKLVYKKAIYINIYADI